MTSRAVASFRKPLPEPPPSEMDGREMTERGLAIVAARCLEALRREALTLPELQSVARTLALVEGARRGGEKSGEDAPRFVVSLVRPLDEDEASA